MSKYDRTIIDRNGNVAVVDVYDVLRAFNVTCPALQHLAKKALCVGIRGHKSTRQDLDDVVASALRARQLLDQKLPVAIPESGEETGE